MDFTRYPVDSGSWWDTACANSNADLQRHRTNRSFICGASQHDGIRYASAHYMILIQLLSRGVGLMYKTMKRWRYIVGCYSNIIFWGFKVIMLKITEIFMTSRFNNYTYLQYLAPPPPPPPPLFWIFQNMQTSAIYSRSDVFSVLPQIRMVPFQ